MFETSDVLGGAQKALIEIDRDTHSFSLTAPEMNGPMRQRGAISMPALTPS
jgi:hypothetical protein